MVQRRSIHISNGQSESSARALLATCRQIHGESVGIYYNDNSFIGESDHLYLSSDLIAWLVRIGPRKRTLLRDVRVCLPTAVNLSRSRRHRTTEDQEKLSSLRECINRLTCEGLWLPLTVLRVRVGCEYLNHCELEALVGAEEVVVERDREAEVLNPPPHVGPYIRKWRLM